MTSFMSISCASWLLDLAAGSVVDVAVASIETTHSKNDCTLYLCTCGAAEVLVPDGENCRSLWQDLIFLQLVRLGPRVQPDM